MTTKATNAKDKIFFVAAKMFAEQGYNNVSLRQIAAEVGIKAASIYYHYLSKEDMLKAMYDFHTHHHNLARPKIEDLLESAKTQPPKQVLMSINYHVAQEAAEVMTYILRIALQDVFNNSESVRLIRANTMDYSYATTKLLLDRMIELKRIQPLDTNAFAKLSMYYAFGAAALDKSALGVTLQEWTAGLELLNSLIIPTTNAKT